MLGWGDSLSLELQSLASVNYFLHYPQIPSDNNDPPYTMSVNVLHTCCTLLWVKYAGGESEAVWSKERERPAALVCRLNVCVVIFLPHVGLISLERSRHDVGLTDLTFHLWVTVCVCCITGEIRKRDRKQSLLDYSFLWLFMPFLASVCCVHWRADRDSSSCSLTEVHREQTWYWWSAWTWHYYKTCHNNGFCWTRNNCDQWYYW